MILVDSQDQVFSCKDVKTYEETTANLLKFGYKPENITVIVLSGTDVMNRFKLDNPPANDKTLEARDYC